MNKCARLKIGLSSGVDRGSVHAVEHCSDLFPERKYVQSREYILYSTCMHSWVFIPLFAYSDIRLNPLSDRSHIGPKGCQSDIISDIELTLLAISDIGKFVFLYVGIYMFHCIH